VERGVALEEVVQGSTSLEEAFLTLMEQER
jgi:hypothetical protein